MSPKHLSSVRFGVSLSCPCVWIRENLYLFVFYFHKPFGDCGLSITNFLSLSGDRLGDPTKLSLVFINPLVIVGYQLPHKSQSHNGLLQQNSNLPTSVILGSSPSWDTTNYQLVITFS